MVSVMPVPCCVKMSGGKARRGDTRRELPDRSRKPLCRASQWLLWFTYVSSSCPHFERFDSMVMPTPYGDADSLEDDVVSESKKPESPRREGLADGAPASKAPLDRRTIAREALALIDEHGVSGFSMRKLGAALGVDPMAVYYYYPSKAAVFDGIVELVWSSFDLDALGAAGGSWQDMIVDAMTSIRAMLLAHPKAIALVGTRPVQTREMFLVFDRAMGKLADRGLSVRDAAELFNAVALFTIGSVLAEAADPVGGGPADGKSWGDALGDVPPEEIPNIASAIAAGWTWEPDAQFSRGLHALVAGWVPVES